LPLTGRRQTVSLDGYVPAPADGQPAAAAALTADAAAREGLAAVGEADARPSSLQSSTCSAQIWHIRQIK